MSIRTMTRDEIDFNRTIYSDQAPDPTLRYVRLSSEDNVVLSALLFTPPAPNSQVFLLAPGLNGAVLGGFHDYRPLARRLAEAGIALLLLNMRSSNNFAHARFEDCRLDIAAGLNWLKSEGYDRIALFGTSLGGPRAMYFNHEVGDPCVCMMGFIASIRSPYLTMADGPMKAHVPELEQVLEGARRAVAEGRPREGVTFDHFLPNRPQTLSAASFLSFFGAPGDSKVSTIAYGHAVSVPTLVVHGTADEVANPSNSRDIYDSLVNAPERDLVIVEGANHYLTAGWISAAYAEIIGDWVEKQFARQTLEEAAE